MKQLRRIILMFKQPLFTGTVLVITVLFSTLSFALAVRSTIALTFRLPVESFPDRIALFSSIVQAIPFNLGGEAMVFIFIIAFLMGVNIALLVYYFRSRAFSFRKSSAGFFGAVSGLVGVGCASCGSVLLSSIIGLSASSAFIGLFPLRGAEFSLLSIGLLGYSIHSLSRKLSPERMYSCDI